MCACVRRVKCAPSSPTCVRGWRGFSRSSGIDAILFGSYARGDAEDGSDIDVMFLVDAPRQDIARQHWRIGEAAAEILLERGVLVSPVVEERAYYERNADVLPLFRNVRREGVAIHG